MPINWSTNVRIWDEIFQRAKKSLNVWSSPFLTLYGECIHHIMSKFLRGTKWTYTRPSTSIYELLKDILEQELLYKIFLVLFHRLFDTEDNLLHSCDQSIGRWHLVTRQFLAGIHLLLKQRQHVSSVPASLWIFFPQMISKLIF